MPPIPGLDEAQPWTNRQGTSARELPRSLVILGGGPTGIELAQVYARFGVPVSIVHSHEQLNQRDHPKNSEAIRAGLERYGVKVVTPVRAERVVPATSPDGDHEVQLSDGQSLRGQHLMLSIGRTVPTDGLGLENAGVSLKDGKLPWDGNLRLGRWPVGRRRSRRSRDAHPRRALPGRDGRAHGARATTSSPITARSRAASTRTRRPAALA